MSFHYTYGGSTAKRTLNCPGWKALAFTLNLVDKSNEHADRGTMLHTCCEILENEGIEYDELLERGVTYEGISLTEELLEEKVIPAMEALEDFVDNNGLTTIITEELIEYSEIIGGTPDILGYSDKLIACADYKFGDGLMVYADDNDQMYFCVWVALDSSIFDSVELFPDTPVIFAIIQPSDKRDKTLDVWETTVDKVDAFGDRFLAAVKIAENSKPGENLCDGDWCTFCPAAGVCPQKGQKARTALALISNAQITDSKQLIKKGEESIIPVLDLSEALKLAKQLEPWIKDVRSFAYDQLEAGADVPDWKLVPKKATRKWIDPDATAEYLKRKLTAKVAMKSEVISPAQAEKAAKKMGVKLRMKDRTSSKSSGTTLVPASDKREAVLNQKEISETLKLIENKDEN